MLVQKAHYANHALEFILRAVLSKGSLLSIVNATEDGRVRVRNPPVKVLDLHGGSSWHKS